MHFSALFDRFFDRKHLYMSVIIIYLSKNKNKNRRKNQKNGM